MFDPPQHLHLTDEQMFHYLYGDLLETEKEHLESCGVCQSEIESFRRTLDHLAQWSAPPRSADYGNFVWRRLITQIAAPRKPLWSRPVVLGWFSLVATGLAAVLIVLIPHHQSGANPSSPVRRVPVSERLLQVAVQDHVRRASSLFAKLENQPGTGTANQSERASEWEAISNLIAENRLYRQTAEQEDDRHAVQLLTDLETALVTLKHISGRPSAAEVQDLKKRLTTVNSVSRMGGTNSPPADSGPLQVKRIPL
jgi:hypothetical protein